MALQALVVFFLGADLLSAGSQGARLRTRRRSTRQPICKFSIFRDGQTRNAIASQSNVVFRSNDVLVVQEGPQRVMVFFLEGGKDSKDSYCHEQAEVACGDLSAQPKSRALLQSSDDGDASAACESRQACNPDTSPSLSCVRSMIGGAVVTRKGEMKRVANIGLGAGSIALFWSRVQPNTRVEAIDISADVIAAAPCFGVQQGPNLQLIQSDGRKYIESQKDGSYDVVFVDAFDNQSTIPPCLKTVEFFKMVSKKLAPGGVLSMNVWRRELDAVYTAFARAFPGRTQVGQSPGLRNIVLLGRSKGGASITQTDDNSDLTSRMTKGLASAGEWAIDAQFGSETLRVLRAAGHVLQDDPKTSSSRILQDVDICPTYASGHQAAIPVDHPN